MKVFYHNDNDGKAAAAMLNLLAEKEMLLILNKSDFIEVDYNSSRPTSDQITVDEIVYIVDYSFTEATFNQLKSICTKSQYVVWLDHHKSSLEVKERAEKICSYVEIDTERSGALITYDLFIRGKEYDSRAIRRIIELVDDYDRWIHKYPESMLFNNGSILYNTYPMSFIWRSSTIYLKAIDDGRVIKKYKDATSKNNVEKSGYEVTINGHKCIVLNTPEFSSQAFGKYYKKYNFAIRYNFNGKLYQYSIYSNLEDIDCSFIAKRINPTGGGHKGAAGCTSDKIEFIPGNTYWFR